MGSWKTIYIQAKTHPFPAAVNSGQKVIEFCEEFVGSEEAEKLHQWAEYLGQEFDWKIRFFMGI